MNKHTELRSWIGEVFLNKDNKAFELVELSGGKNNAVFCLTDSVKTKYTIKIYNPYHTQNFNRLQSEWNFLSQAEKHGIENVPKPLFKNEKLYACIYSYEPGTKLRSNQIEPKHIQAAANFICSINKKMTHVSFGPAADYCRSLSDHLRIVEKRVMTLHDMDMKLSNAQRAVDLVNDKVIPQWKRIIDEIKSKISIAELEKNNKLFLSPSDFGFHNILWNGNTPTFLDFEYAGLDDLAKLTNDFFLCPQIKADVKYKKIFVDLIANSLDVDSNFTDRCKLTHNIHKIKWICIILKDFHTHGNKQRSFISKKPKKHAQQNS